MDPRRTSQELPSHRMSLGTKGKISTRQYNEKKKSPFSLRTNWLRTKGCAQRPGLDFIETYSPGSKIEFPSNFISRIRTLYQLDIEMAYINGELERIYETARRFQNVGYFKEE